MARNSIRVTLGLVDRGFIPGIANATNKAAGFGKSMQLAGAAGIISLTNLHNKLKETGVGIQGAANKAGQAGSKFSGAGQKAGEAGNKFKGAGDKAKSAGDKFKGVGDEAGRAGSKARTGMDGAGAATTRLGSKARHTKSEFRSLGSEIGSTIAKTYLWVQALQAALGVVTKIGDQFNKASDMQMGGINTTAQISAITGESFNAVEKQITASNKRLAKAAQTLPVSTQQILETRSNVIDNIILAQKEETGTSNTAEAIRRSEGLGTNMALFGQATGLGPVQLQQSVNRMLSPDVTEARLELSQVNQMAPGVMNMVDEYAASLGKGFNDLTRFERLEAFEAALERIYTPQVIDRMEGTSRSQLIAATERLFDPTTGIFGFLRDLRPDVEGEQTVMSKIDGLIFHLFDPNAGLFGRLATLADRLGLSSDPMANLYNGIDKLIGWIDTVNRWLDRINGVTDGKAETEVKKPGLKLSMEGAANTFKKEFESWTIESVTESLRKTNKKISAGRMDRRRSAIESGRRFWHESGDEMKGTTNPGESLAELKRNWGAAIEVLNSIDAAGQAASDALVGPLVGVGVGMFEEAKTTVLTGWKYTTDQLKEKTGQLKNATVSFGGRLKTLLYDPVANSLTQLGDRLKQATDNFRSWASTKWTQITDSGQRFFDKVKEIMDRLVTWVVTQLNKIPFVNIPVPGQQQTQQPSLIDKAKSLVDKVVPDKKETIEKTKERAERWSQPKRNVVDNIKDAVRPDNKPESQPKPRNNRNILNNIWDAVMPDRQASVPTTGSFNPVAMVQDFVAPTHSTSNSSVTSVADNRRINLTVVQQPGEDTDSLTNKVMAQLERQYTEMYSSVLA